MTIDSRYCPAIVEGVCDRCLNYSSYCQARWAGTTRTLTCATCRALMAQPVAPAPKRRRWRLGRRGRR